jgi:hypothetical protein
MPVNRRLLVSFASSLLIAAGWSTAAFAGPADSAPSVAPRGGCAAQSPISAAVRGTWKTVPSTRAQAAPRDISDASLQGNSEQSADSSIVGLWQFQFISERNEMIPDGTVLDSGYAQWHQDGTEIMNSMRPPATGNFCLGVWRRAGGSTYELNHFGLSWDMSEVFVGPATSVNGSRSRATARPTRGRSPSISTTRPER